MGCQRRPMQRLVDPDRGNGWKQTVREPGDGSAAEPATRERERFDLDVVVGDELRADHQLTERLGSLPVVAVILVQDRQQRRGVHEHLHPISSSSERVHLVRVTAGPLAGDGERSLDATGIRTPA